MIADTRKLFSALILLTAAWLAVRYLLPILYPFLLGTGLALLAEPGVRLLSQKLHLPRAAAAGIGVSAVFAVLCVLLITLFAFAFRELGILAGVLPDMEVAVQDAMDSLQAWLLQLAQKAPQSIRAVLQRNIAQLFSGGTVLLDRATRYALGLAGTLLGHVPDSALNLGTTIFSAFLISAKLPAIRSRLYNMLPKHRPNPLPEVLNRAKQAAGLWLLAQCKLTGITCLILTVGLFLLRVPHAPLWALAAAAVDAFPILGTGTVLVPWAGICLLQHNVPRAVGLLGLYAVAALTRSMLEPRFIGRQLGLDPLVTLFALYAGFRLFGLAGMLLMPMVAVTSLRLLPGREE